MGRVLTTFVASVLLSMFVSAASADAPDRTGQRLEQLLHRLEALSAPAAAQPAAAAVTRTAAIHIVGTITKKSALTLPIRCQAFVNHNNAAFTLFFTEEMSKLVTFNGNTGTCNLLIPFKWTGADTSKTVDVSVIIFTDDCVCAEAEITRSTDVTFLPFALPAEGTTRNLTFVRDM